MAQLLDARGNPVDTSNLKREIAVPSMSGVRSPISGYPGDGLEPQRLAQILRAADHGDMVHYLELAETIEERDLHYVGVLGTRKRSVSQIGVTVKPASDKPHDVKLAEMVEAWLARDELSEEMFDILDAVGKGYSFTEIIWDTSMGQWMPMRLERRDPRWFRFDRADLHTPLMLDDNGQEIPLPAFKFIFANIKAKSGIVPRSGLARIAMWAYLFKKYTERDWAIFTQTFAQPLRLGKFGPNATDQDKKTLFQAVANIAGDCAAIIPESMMIDFVETANLGTSHALYKERADWLDQQTSKAVLGQTTTTDAISGGHAVSKEHRQVQEDIERADAIALQAILNREVIRPWVDLEYGPQKRYPKIIIARPEQEDVAQLSSSLSALVPLGLEVSEQEVRGKLGLFEPRAGDKILGQNASGTPPNARPPQPQPASEDETAPQSKTDTLFERQVGLSGAVPAPQAEMGLSGPENGLDQIQADLVQRLAEAATAPGRQIMSQIEAMVAAANSLEELQEMLQGGFGKIDVNGLADVIADALMAAHAGGRVTVSEEDDG